MKILMLLYLLLLLAEHNVIAQYKESVPEKNDTTLRITNLNPLVTLATDSILNDRLEVNKANGKYLWYLRSAPFGVKIDRDNGQLYCKADKFHFLSGKLEYDYPYIVTLGVSNTVTGEKTDTSFKLIFYNTEIIPSLIKLSVKSPLSMEEGDTLSFRIQCETGTFPIEHITYYSDVAIKLNSPINACGDEFSWTASYDFIKDTEPAKEKVVAISFVGTTRIMRRDTTTVRILVKNAMNYPVAEREHVAQVTSVKQYIKQLKFAFLQLDKSIRKVKNTRTVFDITTSATALSGTILSSSTNTDNKQMGVILPSIGVSLVPVKEAVSPQKVYDQNQATAVRAAIKRLEYVLEDNKLLEGKDPNIITKTMKIKDELKQAQSQLIDIPIDMTDSMTEKELDDYFKNPKVNKKYRMRN